MSHETWFDVSQLTPSDARRRLDLIIRRPAKLAEQPARGLVFCYIRGFVPGADATIDNVFERLTGDVVAWHHAYTAQAAYEGRA
jgi:hypothetical protein